MGDYENPERDYTPWGSDERWDRDYVEHLTDLWSKGVNEAMFILEVSQIPPDGKVLDLGCGIGRHSLIFARAGCDVVAMDINRFAIKRAQDLARSKSLRASFIHGDFREISYDSEFDLAMLIDDTFGIFDEEGNLSLLAKISRALKEKGLLIIDTYNRERMVERLGFQKGIGRNWKEMEGRLASKNSAFDLQRSRFNTWSEYMVLKTGEKVQEPVRSLRLYTLCELTHILAGLKLSLSSAYGDFDGSDYTVSSERMIIVAAKSQH
jgi:SAM-dependent methyltransferase